MIEAKQELLRKIMARARESIALSQQCLDSGRFAFAAINAYAAAFHAMKALLEFRQVEASKHRRVLGEFNRCFVHTGLIRSTNSKALDRLFSHRQTGSYSYEVEISEQDAREDLAEAQKILNECEGFLRQQTQDEFFRADNSQ